MLNHGIHTEAQGFGRRVRACQDAADISDQRSTAHSLREGPFGLLARGDFPLQVGGVGQYIGIEAAVLIDAPYLCREDAGETLVLAGEFLASQFVDETDEPVD